MDSSISRKRRKKGQGLVEYSLILVLVGIIVIAALMILGPVIGNVFSQINNSLSGISAVEIGEITTPPPIDCSAQQASFITALNAYNACMDDHHNEANHCQSEQAAVDTANSALEACTLP